jgi:hypothetical protein
LASAARPVVVLPDAWHIVNGLDFWRRRSDLFIENWVFVDMLHLFRQFGVDLLGRIPRPRFRPRSSGPDRTGF